MSDAPMLEASNLRKSFGPTNRRLEVLSQVDIRLQRGEMAALLGASGSGKSTLIQILGSLDRPTSGSVRLQGTDPFALPRQQQAAFRNRHIGFIYQSHRLLPEFSARENVMLPLLIHRTPRHDATDRAEQLLTEVGLGERLDHRPGQLSGGEQQRVAIARALAMDPDLLLADEPTGNLDRATAQAVFELLMDMNRKRALTCLMVTHNAELAAALDRRFLLVDGTLKEQS